MSVNYDDTYHDSLPGQNLDKARMPGHWLLARLGKRVLRPGGLELTRKMLAALDIKSNDDVVEFAPGLGVTARMTLAMGPRTYHAIERDPKAALIVQKAIDGRAVECHAASADDTGLPGESASVVYGEAMLSMQTEQQKARIISEAARLLRPGGRYGIHELCLHPDDLSDSIKDTIRREMSGVVHVGVRPLTVAEWTRIIEGCGLKPCTVIRAPFRLLEPARIIRDEGILGAIRFLGRVLSDRPARQRVMQMRRTFRKHRQYLAAVVFVAQKA